MENKSLDPRVNRLELPSQETPYEDGELMQWQTYEVFTQQERGGQHIHVGPVHAPNPEMALILAKEQFGRREQCANIWVVKSGDIHATSYEDSDMFQHAFDKTYREGEGYKVKDTIETFKRELFARIDAGTGSGENREQVVETATVEQRANVKVVTLPTLEGKAPRKIIIKN